MIVAISVLSGETISIPCCLFMHLPPTSVPSERTGVIVHVQCVDLIKVSCPLSQLF